MQTFGRRPSTAAPALPPPRPNLMEHSHTYPAASSCSSSFSSSSTSSTSSSSSSTYSFRSLRRGVLTRDLSIDDLIVPKNRRPRFDLFLQIHDLNNVPLVSGQAYVKWHVEGSARADSRGRTSKENIKDHKVSWQYSHVCQNLRTTVGRDGMLQDLLIFFEINQEYSGARERILLGTVSLNLAEYASVKKETRRYLMQESKINSTLQLTIALTQTGGDTNYVAPMLRGAQVFSGIAGIMTGEPREQEETGKMASLTSQARETDAVQDMYRRTLAASWQLQSGELNAEECIEDIFAGGDGWTSRSERGKPKSVRYESSVRDGSDSESLSAASTGGRSEILSVPTVMGAKEGRRKRDTDVISVMSVATSLHPERKTSRKSVGSSRSWMEVDELQARESLVSWRMPSATWG